jgi:hypothetical protein
VAVYDAPLVAATENVAFEQVSAVIVAVSVEETSSVLQAWKIENISRNMLAIQNRFLFILVVIVYLKIINTTPGSVCMIKDENPEKNVVWRMGNGKNIISIIVLVLKLS